MMKFKRFGILLFIFVISFSFFLASCIDGGNKPLDNLIKEEEQSKVLIDSNYSDDEILMSNDTEIAKEEQIKKEQIKESQSEEEQSIEESSEEKQTEKLSKKEKSDEVQPEEDEKAKFSVGQAEKVNPASKYIYLSIQGPKDKGVILNRIKVYIDQGDTVFDVIKKTTIANGIQMEYSGEKRTAYIKGINNIYEFDYGSKSGWIYRVNGEILNVGSGAYEVKNGDIIEWLYTIDLGNEFIE